MPDLPSDAPDDIPDDLRAWLEADYGDAWSSAAFHGSDQGDWSIEIFYDDGTSSSFDLGNFDSEPAEWVWDLYDWLDVELGGDVDVDYSEAE